MSKPLLHQIRASAGSGKTYELTRRYLEHLAKINDSAPPSMYARAANEILAITFTNAAANEMRQRVITRIKEAALGANDAVMSRESAESWLDIFLHDLSALNIRTIDSLLHQITRASALDLGISPAYETIFDAEEAFAPYLDLLREDASLPGEARDLLTKACEVIIGKDRSSSFTSRNVLAKRLKEVLDHTLAGKFEHLASAEILENLKEQGRKLLGELASRFLITLGPNTRGINAGALKVIEKAAHGELEKGSAHLEKPDIQNICNKGFEPPDELVHLYHQMSAIAQAFFPQAVALDSALAWLPFIQIARRVARDFKTNQEKEGLLPQAQVPGMAKNVLEPPIVASEALCRLGTRLKHYLVDEFQDTSDEQWGVLETLVHEAVGRGGTMIIVGDPKQSIYGFRGGNPQLFNQAFQSPMLRRVVPQIEEPTKLEMNRRSLANIVKHNNQFFAQLRNPPIVHSFLEKVLYNHTPREVIEKGAEKIAEVYADVVQEIRERPDIPYEGYVSVECLKAKDVTEKKEERLTRLCELIQTGIQPRRRWSDVLVLVRSNDFAREIAGRLALLGIPTITENGLLLRDNALIRQTIQFLTFLDNPADDIAFYSFVTGEVFAGHPEIDADLWQEMPAIAAERRDMPLYLAFQERFPDIWEKFLAPFFNQGSLLTPYDTVMEWYYLLNVEERFRENATMLRRFLEVLHLGEDKGLTSLISFLEFWQEEGADEKAPMPENMEAVRIMTIHKAKGLQAKVAIIPDTNFAVKVPDHPIPMTLCGYDIAPRLTSEMGAIYGEEMVDQTLEALNLLYVAMTRAEEELYIFTSSTDGNYANLGKGIDILFKALSSTANYTVGTIPKLTVNPEPAENRKRSTRACEKPESWIPMHWLPRLKIFRTHIQTGELTANERGILIHSALQLLQFDLPPQEAGASALRQAERLTGFQASDRENIIALLAWFAQIPEAADWVASGLSEHSLIDHMGRLLRPDLIVPQQDGFLVIDYKTGHAVSEAHISQVRNYIRTLEATRQFTGQGKGLLIYLDLQKFRIVDAAQASDLQARLN